MPLARLVLAAACIGALVAPAAKAESEGFPTNLALLDRLADEAVDAVLDSLAFQKGDTVTVMTEGGNEGDGFIAGAFARELSRRGVAVHMTVEVMPVPPAAVPQGSLTGRRQDAGANSAPDSLGGAPDSSATAPDSLGSTVHPDSGGVSTPAGSAPGSVSGADSGSGSVSGSTSESASGTAPESASAAAPSRPGPTVVRRTYPSGRILEFRLLEFGVGYPNVKRRYRLFGSPTVTRLGGVYVQASRIVGPDGTVEAMASGQSHAEDRLSAKARRLAEGANYPFTKPAIPAANFGRVVEPVAVVGIVASLVYLFYQNQN
jgi:hypothetical protein